MIDPFSLLPSYALERALDSALDSMARLAENLHGDKVAKGIRRLKSDGKFRAEFAGAVKAALVKFHRAYRDVDQEVAERLALDRRFWTGQALMTSMEAIIRQAGSTAADDARRTVEEHFRHHLGEEIGAERAHNALVCFLNCLAEEVWHLPELHGIYSLYLQRASAQATAAIVDELRELRRDTGRITQVPTQSISASEKATATAESVNNLPRDVMVVGRKTEIQRILRQPDRPGTLVIDTVNGMAGIGKTALAVHVAHKMRDDYPDGCFFLDLHGYTAGQPPLQAGEALGMLLRMARPLIGQIPLDMDERTALWRSAMSSKRALLVLDNALDHEQVRPLLPGTATCRVIITSRRQLTGLGHAQPLSLRCLQLRDAVQLLTNIIGAERAGREPGQVRTVAELCGRLPLALQLAGNRLKYRPEWDISSFARRLRAAKSRSLMLRAEDMALEAAFKLSYAGLEARQQLMFRRLSLHEGATICVGAAAALYDADRETVEDIIETLVDHSLLEEATAGRYQFHDLLKDFARNMATSSHESAELRSATERIIQFYLAGSRAASVHINTRLHPAVIVPDDTVSVRMCFAGRVEALRWMEQERLNLFGVARQAQQVVPTAVCDLAAAAAGFLLLRGYIREAVDLHSAAVGVASQEGGAAMRAVSHENCGTAKWELGSFQEALVCFNVALGLYKDLADVESEARVLDKIGFTYERTGDYPDALRVLQESFDIRSRLGDLHGQAKTLNSLGAVHWRKGTYVEALRCFVSALGTRIDISDLHGQARTLNNIGFTFERMNKFAESKEYLLRALDLALRLGDRQIENTVYNNLGYLHVKMGECELAQKYSLRGQVLARQTGSVYEEARALDGLGRARLCAGRRGEARGPLGQALILFQGLGVPEAVDIRRILADMDAADSRPGPTSEPDP
ncbi:Tetratricopeptide repeat-containing protein [Nonomuraea solani]|uniref:Tetratricopeptide repeat-containing protein n=1 Tax=Nonomuraea solani TaxID=1144553 RepID=A0A1H5T1F4_9ACTN|nr:tetratricopeptide repeat protein [Nonomuraea solani]SEF55998.1 Tetratricopeptide repeat-containing protein [Nonomuraea solani]